METFDFQLHMMTGTQRVEQLVRTEYPTIHVDGTVPFNQLHWLMLQMHKLFMTFRS
jgi:hypothetical protein